SKRPLEITLPSSLSQPSSYGCDKCPHYLAVLQRLIEQLPGRDQVLQHALQAGAIDRAAGTGAESRGRIQPFDDAVLVMFEEAEVDAVLAALIVLVPGLGFVAVHGIAVILGKAQLKPLFDRAERGRDRGVRQPLHRLDAMLFEDALHAADGVALAVQQPADAFQQI